MTSQSGLDLPEDRAQQREAQRQAEHLFQTLLHRASTREAFLGRYESKVTKEREKSGSSHHDPRLTTKDENPQQVEESGVPNLFGLFSE